MNVYWGNIKEYQEVLEILHRLSESVEEYFRFPARKEEVQEANKTLIPRVKKVFYLKKELYYAVVEAEQGDQALL